MKKYKLIKEYPGSPKLGTIVEQRLDTNFEDRRGSFHRRYEIIDYPEFWEEVKEKEYKILSFTDGCETYKLCRFGAFSNFKSYYNEEGLLKRKDVKIHSVKRLSDGEIFTVGDIIEDEDGRDYKNTGIKEFIVDGEGNLDIITDANGNGIVTKDLAWPLEEIKHKKKPLFTTRGGIDIFEFDPIYFTKDSEKIYTKEWVEKLCRDAFFNGILTAHIAKERWSETLNEWLKNNLK